MIGHFHYNCPIFPKTPLFLPFLTFPQYSSFKSSIHQAPTGACPDRAFSSYPTSSHFSQLSLPYIPPKLIKSFCYQAQLACACPKGHSLHLHKPPKTLLPPPSHPASSCVPLSDTLRHSRPLRRLTSSPAPLAHLPFSLPPYISSPQKKRISTRRRAQKTLHYLHFSLEKAAPPAYLRRIKRIRSDKR